MSTTISAWPLLLIGNPLRSAASTLTFGARIKNVGLEHGARQPRGRLVCVVVPNGQRLRIVPQYGMATGRIHGGIASRRNRPGGRQYSQSAQSGHAGDRTATSKTGRMSKGLSQRHIRHAPRSGIRQQGITITRFAGLSDMPLNVTKKIFPGFPNAGFLPPLTMVIGAR